MPWRMPIGRKSGEERRRGKCFDYCGFNFTVGRIEGQYGDAGEREREGENERERRKTISEIHPPRNIEPRGKKEERGDFNFNSTQRGSAVL